MSYCSYCGYGFKIPNWAFWKMKKGDVAWRFNEHCRRHGEKYNAFVKKYGFVGRILWKLTHNNHPQKWMLDGKL